MKKNLLFAFKLSLGDKSFFSKFSILQKSNWKEVWRKFHFAFLIEILWDLFFKKIRNREFVEVVGNCKTESSLKAHSSFWNFVQAFEAHSRIYTKLCYDATKFIQTWLRTSLQKPVKAHSSFRKPTKTCEKSQKLSWNLLGSKREAF